MKRGLVMLAPILSATLMMIAISEPTDCIDRVPMAIPAPSSMFSDLNEAIDIHQQTDFFFRAGSVNNLKLVETPVRRGGVAQEFALSSSGETFVAEGVVFDHFTTPELPLGVCFEVHENIGDDAAFHQLAVYQNNILCATRRGAEEERMPDRLTVLASAQPATYGTPGGNHGLGVSRTAIGVPEPGFNCGQAMVSGSGNVTISIAGIVTSPGAVLVELLGDGEPQARDLFVHERMVDTQQPLIVGYRANTAGDLKVRVTHRVFGAGAGEPVEFDIVEPSSCHQLPGSSVLILLSALALRRRRQLS
jgi:hypothetical protein